MNPLIPLFASAAPLLIWPIELIFPYPYIVEELAKMGLVFLILKSPNNPARLQMAFLVGLLFAFSESVLYIFNVFLVGNIEVLLIRFLLTAPMHILTTLIILLSALKTKKFIWVGVAVAALIHYVFNIWVSSLMR